MCNWTVDKIKNRLRVFSADNKEEESKEEFTVQETEQMMSN